MKQDLVWLLDAGHGGMIQEGENNVYATAPNKMYKHPDGLTIYEGVYNRQVIQLVKDLMDEKGLKYFDVVNSNEDISLQERVDNANEVYKSNPRCIYFSMHGNAANTQACGIEIYTSVGNTNSDYIATTIMKSIVKYFPNEKYRFDKWSDGDIDKEANFKVLRDTKMPAVLLEMLFFDSYSDAVKMNDPDYRARIAEAIVDGFETVETLRNNAASYKSM